LLLVFVICKSSVILITNPNLSVVNHRGDSLSYVVGLETTLDSYAVNMRTGVKSGWIGLLCVTGLKTAVECIGSLQSNKL
jgi:hypothetical protein